MSALTATFATRVVQVGRQCMAPLLLLETLGLLGLLVSWRVATFAAVGAIVVVGAASALRRASRKVDLILLEELGPVGPRETPHPMRDAG